MPTIFSRPAVSALAAPLLGAFVAGCGGGAQHAEGSTVSVTIDAPASGNVAPGRTLYVRAAAVAIRGSIERASWTVDGASAGATALVLSNADCAEATRLDEDSLAATYDAVRCELAIDAPQAIDRSGTHVLRFTAWAKNGDSATVKLATAIRTASLTASMTAPSVADALRLTVVLAGTATSADIPLLAASWKVTALDGALPVAALVNAACAERDLSSNLQTTCPLSIVLSPDAAPGDTYRVAFEVSNQEGDVVTSTQRVTVAAP